MGIKQQGRGMGLQAAAIASQINLNDSQAEKNKEAERAAKYRQLKNAFGGETLKDGELGYGDLFEAGSNVLSVLPVLKGVGMAETATRQALTQGGKQGAVTATKGVLSGVDEALVNLRDFRNIFRKPNIAKYDVTLWSMDMRLEQSVILRNLLFFSSVSDAIS